MRIQRGISFFLHFLLTSYSFLTPSLVRANAQRQACVKEEANVRNEEAQLKQLQDKFIVIDQQLGINDLTNPTAAYLKLQEAGNAYKEASSLETTKYLKENRIRKTREKLTQAKAKVAELESQKASVQKAIEKQKNDLTLAKLHQEQCIKGASSTILTNQTKHSRATPGSTYGNNTLKGDSEDSKKESSTLAKQDSSQEKPQGAARLSSPYARPIMQQQEQQPSGYAEGKPQSAGINHESGYTASAIPHTPSSLQPDQQPLPTKQQPVAEAHISPSGYSEGRSRPSRDTTGGSTLPGPTSSVDSAINQYKNMREQCLMADGSIDTTCMEVAEKAREAATLREVNANAASHAQDKSDLSNQHKAMNNEKEAKPIAMTDQCSATVLGLLAEEASQTNSFGSRQEMLDYVHTNMTDKKNQLMKKYGCRQAETKLTAYEAASQFTDIAASSGAQLAGMLATNKVQNDQIESMKNGSDPITVQKSALEQMSKTYKTAAGINSVTALSNLAMLGATADIARKQNKAAKEAARLASQKMTNEVSLYSQEACRNNPDPMCKVKLASVAQGVGSLSSDEDLTGKTGAARLSESAEAHGQMAAAAQAQLFAQTQKFVTNMASSIQNGIAAKQLQEQANQLQSAGGPITNPLVATGDGGGSWEGGGVLPGMVDPTGLGSDGSSAAVVEDPTNTDPALPIPPPLFGGGGNPGGLQDAPVPMTGGLIGNGTTSGGGGGGLGGFGGGGGGGDNGGGGDPGWAEQLTDKTKFEGTGSGGNFMAAGNRGGSRNQDTGMDINGLLARFMPQKEDRMPSSIIDGYGNNGTIEGTEGPGNVDDGSILGKNSNLFQRVSDTTMAQYKRGNLK